MGRAVHQILGKYGASCEDAVLFSTCNSVGKISTVGLAATYTGLVIANPVANTVKASICFAKVIPAVAFAAASVIGIMTGAGALTSTGNVLAIQNRYIGSTKTSKLVSYDGAALPGTPILTHLLGVGLTGAITLLPNSQGVGGDMDGCLEIPPGQWAAIYTSTVSGAAGIWSQLMWKEWTPLSDAGI